LTRRTRLIKWAFGGIGLALIVSPFSFPAFAQDAERWIADTSRDRCALQYNRPPGEVLFELALDDAGGSYAINGMVLSGYSQSELRDLRIAMNIGRRTVVLSETRERMIAFLSREEAGTPIPIVFQALDESQGDEVILTVDNSAQIMSKTGYDRARQALEKCLNAFIYRTEARSSPRLVEFTGLQALVAEAGRQRLLSQSLSYTLNIDETGKPTDCEFSRRFRRKATKIALCRPMLKSMIFEPARDPSGEPIQGTYEGVIDFQMWMRSDGYLCDH